ncbi:MAG: ATP-dependent RNA helicase HrpA, partial [Ectothiorhodospiraceae bacterium]|nr:ATP-dependent RNA helicase HrpA [Ectothiorhodospiraceae bacterium]
LHELGAVDDHRRLTSLGHRLARLPVAPSVGRMLLAGDAHGALREVLVIAAALSIQDPRERPLSHQQAADQAHAVWKDERSDFVSYLKLWDAWQQARADLSRNKQRGWAREHFLSHVRLRDWMDVHRQLKELAGALGLGLNQQPADVAELHRALLTGMLANVATRSEEQEYTGARNLKLLIFPGSGVARKRPKWIMAAEIVETSRVFARTVAQVEPADVERLAAHLVSRSYSDPHWEPRQGRVLAYETVSLYGLVLTARRKVNYGPVDPVVAREIFLRQGLAEDRLASKGAFLAHNRALFEEIRELEAKSRRRDVLVDEETLYGFYDTRIPADVVDAKSFEAWRRQAERENPRLLHMRREDLMQHEAEAVTEDAFPDQLSACGLRLPLSYHFEPGHAADGVSVQVPLAALNQLRPEPFEWLVPGLLEDKVTALIRGLPKALRKNFVPAPDFAAAVLDNLTPGEGSLVDGVRRELRRMTGVDVSPEQWDTARLETHFHMNFQVLDAGGETLAMGRDLAALQARLGEQARQNVSALKPDAGLEREGITRWDFGALPESVEYQQQGVGLKAYPALVDEGSSVALRLLDDPSDAAHRSRAGVRRLLMLALRDQMRYLATRLPEMERMGLQYAPLGNSRALKDELLAAVVDQTFLQGPLPRDQEAFTGLLEQGRGELVPNGERFARRVAGILEHYHTLRTALKRPRGLEGMESFRDMAEHMDSLVFPEFLTRHPAMLLEQLPRYLEALRYRLDKQAAEPARDAQRTRQLRPWWERYTERRDRHQRQGIDDPALVEFRLMLEEYRVSVFAQPVGTSMPVSEKRLKEAWAAVR